MASLHTLKRIGKRAYRRVGRGQSSTRGKQSGRGGKGQTARAGHKMRPEIRDIIKKLPKRRGYGKNRARTVIAGNGNFAIPVGKLEKYFSAGGEVSQKTLLANGVIRNTRQMVKIVGGGEVSKKYSVVKIPVSAGAKAAIEKAGGSVA